MLSHKQIGRMVVILLAGVAGAVSSANTAEAGYRQYYSAWSHHASNGYFYRHYYFKPAPQFKVYHHNFCIYFPSKPRYVYFYNPVRRVYWGRFDTQGRKGAQYSLLDEADQSGDLKSIPGSAFPPPGAMPAIPNAVDTEPMEPVTDLPAFKKKPRKKVAEKTAEES